MESLKPLDIPNSEIPTQPCNHDGPATSPHCFGSRLPGEDTIEAEELWGCVLKPMQRDCPSNQNSLLALSKQPAPSRLALARQNLWRGALAKSIDL